MTGENCSRRSETELTKERKDVSFGHLLFKAPFIGHGMFDEVKQLFHHSSAVRFFDEPGELAIHCVIEFAHERTGFSGIYCLEVKFFANDGNRSSFYIRTDCDIDIGTAAADFKFKEIKISFQFRLSFLFCGIGVFGQIDPAAQPGEFCQIFIGRVLLTWVEILSHSS